MMDIIREDGSRWRVDADDELTEEDAHTFKTPDRRHVNSLLDISEESQAKELLYEIHVQPGWEEAVQGWGTCSPLACLYQLPKCKMAKAGDSEFHCVLCIDVKLSQNSNMDHSADSESARINCTSAVDHGNKGITLHSKQLKRLSSSPLAVPYLSARNNFKVKEKTENQAGFCDKIAEEAKLKILPETLPRLAYINLAIQCPLMRETGIMNNFTVLPPVKGSSSPWSTSSTGRNVVTSNLMIVDSRTAETVSYGTSAGERCVEGEEITPDTQADTGAPEDSCGSLSKCSKYYQSQPRKHLLSAFSINIPKSCDLLQNPSEDTVPQATYLMGRKLKNDNQGREVIKNNQSHCLKQREPQLPVLLGTRVPLVAASHRIIYPSM